MREQETVEIEVEQPAKRLPQSSPHRRGVITHQESRHERKSPAAGAREAVGKRERALAGILDVYRSVVRADGPQLVRGDPRR